MGFLAWLSDKVQTATDWLSDKVQTATGEQERKKLVKEIKDTNDDFKVQVSNNVNSVNNSIESLNDSIKELNVFRASNISENIESLGDFLGDFGNVKKIGQYAAEESVHYITIPEHQFVVAEDYIRDIDWDQKEVFYQSFFLGPLGIKKKTQAQNLEMKEWLNSKKLEAEQTILELKNMKFAAEQDKKIAELYIYCVERIICFIEKVIIPEMDIVEAFFQALAIKNKLIANHSLENIEFKNNINLIQDTQFSNHYRFIRNSFMFYIIACKIYNTPILTKLIKGTTSENDLQEMNKERETLETQMHNVNRYLIFSRAEA